ncbi:PARVA [Cordylochernes scorpioides]|uniref:PARVA n=1 Tax=Cordylochernes scorpioides TaxID=51811 RepID=A0ABY6L6M6_9ARAC|nr:PARVA [Cordylochernes scorpioides]
MIVKRKLKLYRECFFYKNRNIFSKRNSDISNFEDELMIVKRKLKLYRECFFYKNRNLFSKRNSNISNFEDELMIVKRKLKLYRECFFYKNRNLFSKRNSNISNFEDELRTEKYVQGSRVDKAPARMASVKDDFLHYAKNPESELEDTDSDCTIVYDYEESSGEDEEVPPPLKTPRSDYIWSENSNYDPIIFSFDRSNSGLQFHDGVYLTLMMGLLEGYFVPLYAFNLTPASFDQKLHNVSFAFQLMVDSGLPKPKARPEDITKMYRQILVHPEDTLYQRIIWRDESGQGLKEYELKTLTYGTSCAPFLAIRTTEQTKMVETSGQHQDWNIGFVKSDNLPPLNWRMGRINQVYPGEDGLVRVVSVKTADGDLRRAVVKVCPLPLDCPTT